MEGLKKTIMEQRNLADSTMISYMQLLKRLIKLNGDDFIPDTAKINVDKLKKALKIAHESANIFALHHKYCRVIS